MRGGFRIRIPSVPRASIIWLAHAVKVVRPAARRLHLDRVRCAKGWHLGITLGVCMSCVRETHACGRHLLKLGFKVVTHERIRTSEAERLDER
jgi:hypothetical protein